MALARRQQVRRHLFGIAVEGHLKAFRFANDSPIAPPFVPAFLMVTPPGDGAILVRLEAHALGRRRVLRRFPECVADD